MGLRSVLDEAFDLTGARLNFLGALVKLSRPSDL